MNFHFFVLLSTIAFYILLKLYKSSIITKKNKNYPHTSKKNSNLFYILFIPAILYLTRYMYFPFTQNSIEQNTTNFIKPEVSQVQVQNNVISDKLLNSPYPASTSYSSSGSY